MSRIPCSNAMTFTAFRSRLLLRENVSSWPGEFRAAFGRAFDGGGHVADAFVAADARDELGVDHDDVQQIVEVVRDAAGELPERFHLLRLHQHRLHLCALVDLHHQPVVRGREFLRSFGDAAFERIVESLERLLRLWRSTDADATPPDGGAIRTAARVPAATTRPRGATSPNSAAVRAPPRCRALPSTSRLRAERRPTRLPASRMIGKSDHAGCCSATRTDRDGFVCRERFLGDDQPCPRRVQLRGQHIGESRKQSIHGRPSQARPRSHQRRGRTAPDIRTRCSMAYCSCCVDDARLPAPSMAVPPL